MTTTIDTHTDNVGAAPDAVRSSPSALTRLMVGIADWATTVDHKQIGRMFVGFSMLWSLAVAVLGVLLGIERASDSSTMLNANSLLQLFQAYRTLAVLAVIAPAALGIAVAVSPLQVGARSISGPRSALTGLYIWLGGVGLTTAALIGNGGGGGGNANMVDLFLIGQGAMMVGLCLAAGALAVTILSCRCPGMTLRRVPLFTWSALVVSLGALLVLPVAVAMTVMLFVDHRYAAQLAFGGSDQIMVWLQWVWTIPTVLVFGIVAVGLFVELVPVAFRTRQSARGAKMTGLALTGVVALAAVTQQRAFPVSFATAQSFGTFFKSIVVFGAFCGLPVLGLLSTWGAVGATVRSGRRPRITGAFVFAQFGALIVAAAVLGYAVYSVWNLDLIGTAYEEGLTYLAVYGTLLAVIGGLLFWAPKLWGRKIADAKLIPLAMLGTLGAVIAGASMVVAGAFGQVGGIPNNDAAVSALLQLDGVSPLWDTLAAVGHGIVALTVVLVGLVMIQSFTGTGANAGENPDGGHTLEWQTLSPAPEFNYEHVPTVASAEPTFDKTAEGLES